MTPAKPITNQRFGKLLVICKSNNINKRVSYLCKCDCGNEKVILKQSLISGASKSCGCSKRKYLLGGMPSSSSEYKIWHTMNRRCHNKKAFDYSRYGNKGITVCDRWRGKYGFLNFFSDMGKRPSNKHSIDRIDNNGLYTPSNCRWATKKEQARNRKNNTVIKFKGKKKTLAEWAEVTCINQQTLSERLKRGWSVEKTLSTLVCGKCRKN